MGAQEVEILLEEDGCGPSQVGDASLWGVHLGTSSRSDDVVNPEALCLMQGGTVWRFCNRPGFTTLFCCLSASGFLCGKEEERAALGKAGRSHRLQMSPPEAVCRKPESYGP